MVSSFDTNITCRVTPGIRLSKVSCVSAELLAEVLVRLGVARRTIHRVLQDYSICFQEVYSLLQTFIATVRYTLQIDDSWGYPNFVKLPKTCYLDVITSQPKNALPIPSYKCTVELVDI